MQSEVQDNVIPLKIKPRVKFCWECGKKLWNDYFAEFEIYGYKRILHKQCAIQLKREGVIK